MSFLGTLRLALDGVGSTRQLRVKKRAEVFGIYSFRLFPQDFLVRSEQYLLADEPHYQPCPPPYLIT